MVFCRMLCAILLQPGLLWGLRDEDFSAFQSRASKTVDKNKADSLPQSTSRQG